MQICRVTIAKGGNGIGLAIVMGAALRDPSIQDQLTSHRSRRHLTILILTSAMHLAIGTLGANYAPAQDQPGDEGLVAETIDPSGENDVVMQSVVDRFERRFTRMATVRYKLSGTRFWPARAQSETDEYSLRSGGGHAQVPAHDTRESLTRSILLDFSGNRHRIEWDHPEISPVPPHIFRIRCLHVCDGSTVYSRIFENSDPGLRPDSAKKHPDLMIQRGEVPPGVFDFAFLPLLIGHGIVNTGSARVRPGSLRSRIDAQELSHQGIGDYDGRECLIVGTAGDAGMTQQLWIDMERDAAVVRVVIRPTKPVSEIDLTYQETPDGWLVAGWTRRSFDITSGELRREEIVVVDEVIPRPLTLDQDFRIEVEPGMYVEQQSYHTTGLGELVQENEYLLINSDAPPSELNHNLFPRNQLASTQGGTSWRLLLGINAGVLLVVCSVVLYGRWRRRCRP